MHRYYILEGLFILLGLALVVTAIKYPKDVFITLPLEIIKLPFRNLWWLGTSDDDDKPHPSTRNLKVDFNNGDKYVFVLTSTKDLKELIEDFLEVLTGKHSIEEFKIVDNGNQKIIQFPTDINFYDYHLLVQHLSTELGDRKSFGVFKSDKIQYYVFQDRGTLNNLVGFTADKKLFSIYMLDDLERKQHLRLNQKLKVETDWVERVNGTNAQHQL